eukprot:CAMPEP_0174380216 /NCGR_PEP_ID=MMETSP0811_2-20130205/123226_1 /TAXON_ID=73025 ORGANISM="Eutreptiella gymnastica-like, Strain CCMP1594" /NCGR_SAMPLE_ID=MMETSP0811_2 /ASSEMBLY_ACC=CAM_ASM_000667 /LENGTH=47 /DNA_ID= /DNA_START= /DNA_END= /DNA_ORIENTATION=
MTLMCKSVWLISSMGRDVVQPLAIHNMQYMPETAKDTADGTLSLPHV